MGRLDARSDICRVFARNEKQNEMVETAREILQRGGWHGGVSALEDGVAGAILGTRGEAMHEVLQVLAGALVK